MTRDNNPDDPTGESGGQWGDWMVTALWIAVPFPSYLLGVFLVQPWLYKATFGFPMGGPVPSDAITLPKIVVGFLTIIAIVVAGVYVAAVSWSMAKQSKPTGGMENGV